MKKNDLIKTLQSIKGNPEIVVYNRFVDDYIPISKHTENLVSVKETLNHIYNGFLYDAYADKKDITLDEVKQACMEKAKYRYSKQKYDFPNPYADEEWYKKGQNQYYVYI